ncbi:MAG: hypothetical protein WKF92_14615 [Pyrinomonadaceae bacterium]
MAIKIDGCSAVGNAGAGFYVRGDAEMIDCHSALNGGRGFDVTDYSLMEKLGLPKETNPQMLIDWLTILQNQPSVTLEEAESATFWEKAGKIAPPLSIASSLLAILNNPILLQIVKAL